jgi:DNA-directed RNA polymerase specialized sigma24 family protein
MKKDWVVTPQAFDSLLGWLDKDRELAGEKYEKIRLRLIKIFTCRGCAEADDLADETINRVTAKVAELISKYSGDPALYFYGVAQKVHLEYVRTKPVMHELPQSSRARDLNDLEASDELEQEYACLERCMQELPSESRLLVLDYYQEEKGAKIDHRKRQAQELGIALNALRIRAHRLRLQLQKCMEICLEQAPAN